VISHIVALVALFLMASVDAQAGRTREIVDMAGRRVTIPAEPKRIYGSSPPVTLTLYALAPETLIGLNVPFRGDERPYLRKEALDLPVIGSQAGMGRRLNLEEVASLRPDLVIAWLDRFIDPSTVEATFAKIGVPVVFVRLDMLADYSTVFLFLGNLLGRAEKAAELAQYVSNAIERVEKATADIPANERIRVYYAETADGLATDCDKSFHTEPIRLAAGDNVHHCEQSSHFGMDKIGLEQIIALRPELILAQDKRFASVVENNAQWRSVDAVKNGRIVFVPHAPFNWLDRPPSYMRALGIQWLANLFYPHRYPWDLKSETKKFYRLFLDVEPSDEDISRILE
jgi:iron complex transport system substrate-binding protein